MKITKSRFRRILREECLKLLTEQQTASDLEGYEFTPEEEGKLSDIDRLNLQTAAEPPPVAQQSAKKSTTWDDIKSTAGKFAKGFESAKTAAGEYLEPHWEQAKYDLEDMSTGEDFQDKIRAEYETTNLVRPENEIRAMFDLKSQKFFSQDPKKAAKERETTQNNIISTRDTVVGMMRQHYASDNFKNRLFKIMAEQTNLDPNDPALIAAVPQIMKGYQDALNNLPQIRAIMSAEGQDPKSIQNALAAKGAGLYNNSTQTLDIYPLNMSGGPPTATNAMGNDRLGRAAYQKKLVNTLTHELTHHVHGNVDFNTPLRDAGYETRRLGKTGLGQLSKHSDMMKGLLKPGGAASAGVSDRQWGYMTSPDELAARFSEIIQHVRRKTGRNRVTRRDITRLIRQPTSDHGDVGSDIFDILDVRDEQGKIDPAKVQDIADTTNKLIVRADPPSPVTMRSTMAESKSKK